MNNYIAPIGLPSRFIHLDELRFRLFIDQRTIQDRIQQLGEKVKADYSGKRPLVICVLKGAILFLSDLLQSSELPAEIDFVRLSSYEGMERSDNIVDKMPLKTDVKGRDVIIVEDIVDSGATLHHFIQQLDEAGCASIKIAALLVKPEAVKYPIEVDYLGFNIPDLFVIGYGLDYNEKGRSLKDIYQLDLPVPGL